MTSSAAATAGPLATYRTDDADEVLVTMGTMTTTARTVVDELRSRRSQGRARQAAALPPVPGEEIAQSGRTASTGSAWSTGRTASGRWGPLPPRSARRSTPPPHRPLVSSFLAGIGGRDVTPAEGPLDVRRARGR